MRGSCIPYPINALAHPPRAPWEEAPVRSPKQGKYGNEETYGKIQGSAGEGRYGIFGMLRGRARSHDGGLQMEGDLKQKPGVA